MRPNVSVIMPSYNARAFIRRAVDSVLAQTVSDFELLIVDDGSIDDTPDFVAHTYSAEERIRLIQLAENGGPAVRHNVQAH